MKVLAISSSNSMSIKEYITEHLWENLSQTLKMVGLSALIAIFLGLIIGSILFVTRKSKAKWLNVVYKVLDIIVNIFRSFPFAILIFFLVPFTREIMRALTGSGSAFGKQGAYVPLIIAAAPFFSKVIENALIEVDDSVVEAATSLGLSQFQIMTRVVIREALPAIVSGITLGIITLVGFSAMAGYIGAGGLGDFAYQYGIGNYNTDAIIYAVITIILLVQIIQLLGNLVYKLVK